MSIREQAYLLIQQKIARGELRAGNPVLEGSVAEELGSSRTPVREALSQLVAEGLLEQTPNRGTLVVQFTRQDIIDLYEIREALETYAIQKVARRANAAHEIERLQSLSEDIAGLQKELLKSGHPTLDKTQMQRFIASDLGFHCALVRMAANPRLFKMMGETRLLIRVFAIQRSGHDVPTLTQICDDHNRMITAVAENKVGAAVHLLCKHMQTSLQERLAEFDNWELETSMKETLPGFTKKV